MKSGKVSAEYSQWSSSGDERIILRQRSTAPRFDNDMKEVQNEDAFCVNPRIILSSVEWR